MRRSAKELGVGRGDWDADREDEEDSEAPTLLVPSEGGVDALLVLCSGGRSWSVARMVRLRFVFRKNEVL